MLFKNVVCTPGVCSGAPRIEGSRLTCANVVLTLIDQSWSLAEFCKNYPNLREGDIANCLVYCSKRKCLSDKPENYCEGCSLDKREEKIPGVFLDDIHDIEKYRKKFSETDQAYLGSLEDFSKDPMQYNVWELSGNLLRKMNI